MSSVRCMGSWPWLCGHADERVRLAAVESLLPLHNYNHPQSVLQVHRTTNQPTPTHNSCARNVVCLPLFLLHNQCLVGRIKEETKCKVKLQMENFIIRCGETVDSDTVFQILLSQVQVGLTSTLATKSLCSSMITVLPQLY
jgi:hypothetical protein